MSDICFLHHACSSICAAIIPGQQATQPTKACTGEFERADTVRILLPQLHPWFIGMKHGKANGEIVQDKAATKGYLPSGECGLDKVCSTDWHLVNGFQPSYHGAGKIHKPVIIHCVRAYEETLQLIKETGMNTAWSMVCFKRP